MKHRTRPASIKTVPFHLLDDTPLTFHHLVAGFDVTLGLHDVRRAADPVDLGDPQAGRADAGKALRPVLTDRAPLADRVRQLLVDALAQPVGAGLGVHRDDERSVRTGTGLDAGQPPDLDEVVVGLRHGVDGEAELALPLLVRGVDVDRPAGAEVPVGKGLAALRLREDLDLAAGTIVAADIAAGTITGDRMVANTITATQIAADTITAGQIAANAITASELAADSVTANKILAGKVTAGKLAANAVVAGNIAANAVTAGTLAAGAVTAGKIAAGTIVAADIAADTITAAQIAAGAIGAAEISARAITADKLAIGTKNVAFNTDYNIGAGGFGGWASESGSASGFSLGTNGPAGIKSGASRIPALAISVPGRCCRTEH